MSENDIQAGVDKTGRMPRADLVRAYLRAFAHVYGILTQDEALEAFNRYETDAADVEEIRAAAKDLPKLEKYDGCILDEQLVTLCESYPTVIDDILDARRDQDIFYPEKQELLSYPDGYVWGPSYAWMKFLEFATQKRFMEKYDESFYIGLCNDYFLYLQLFFGLSDDYKDPSLWFMDQIDIKNERYANNIEVLAFKMGVTTRLWSEYGRSLLELIQDDNCEKGLNADMKKMARLEKYLEGAIQEQFEQAVSEKFPRNAPCPCGSGKKYKNCCGKNG